MIKHVVTYAGTGTDIVQGVFDTMGVKFTVIEKLKDLEKIKPDALILLGGADINPALYGEKDAHCNVPNKHRDIVEWYMIRQAMNRKQPIMGICRGHQMITVAHGGSLYQDINLQKESSRNHTGGQHRISATGPLANWIPAEVVNSLHHQAVRNVPDGFKVLARSSDEVIEAIWKPGVLGVQWHPELMVMAKPGWYHIFEWFAAGLK